MYAAGFPVECALKTDDVSFAEIENQTQILQDLALKPFDIQLGAINSFQGAPFVEVADGGQMALINQTLSALSGADRDCVFLPHLTLGLYRDAFNPQMLAEKLEQYLVESMTIHCDKLCLLAYDADDLRSPLRVLRTLELKV